MEELEKSIKEIVDNFNNSHSSGSYWITFRKNPISQTFELVSKNFTGEFMLSIVSRFKCEISQAAIKEGVRISIFNLK